MYQHDHVCHWAGMADAQHLYNMSDFIFHISEWNECFIECDGFSWPRRAWTSFSSAEPRRNLSLSHRKYVSKLAFHIEQIGTTEEGCRSLRGLPSSFVPWSLIKRIRIQRFYSNKYRNFKMFQIMYFRFQSSNIAALIWAVIWALYICM